MVGSSLGGLLFVVAVAVLFMVQRKYIRQKALQMPRLSAQMEEDASVAEANESMKNPMRDSSKVASVEEAEEEFMKNPMRDSSKVASVEEAEEAEAEEEEAENVEVDYVLGRSRDSSQSGQFVHANPMLGTDGEVEGDHSDDDEARSMDERSNDDDNDIVLDEVCGGSEEGSSSKGSSTLRGSAGVLINKLTTDMKWVERTLVYDEHYDALKISTLKVLAAEKQIPLASITYVQVGTEEVEEQHRGLVEPLQTLNSSPASIFISAGELSVRIRLPDEQAAALLAAEIRELLLENENP